MFAKFNKLAIAFTVREADFFAARMLPQNAHPFKPSSNMMRRLHLPCQEVGLRGTLGLSWEGDNFHHLAGRHAIHVGFHQ